MAARKTAPDDAAPDPEPETTPYAAPVPAPGWWRNAGETALDVVGDGIGLTVAPGQTVPLPWAPSHAALVPAAEPQAVNDAASPGPDAGPPTAAPAATADHDPTPSQE